MSSILTIIFRIYISGRKKRDATHLKQESYVLKKKENQGFYNKLTLGARRFNIPDKIWNKMTKIEQWNANKKFLDRLIKHRFSQRS